VRILIVNWQDRLNPNAGGAEVHLHEIFGRLARGGHDVSLLVSGWESCAADEQVDNMRVVRTGSRYTFPLHVRRALRSRFAGESFDVLVEDINKLPLFTPLWADAPVVGLVPHLFGATAFQQESLPIAATVWVAERLMPAAYRDRELLVISDSTADDLESRGFHSKRIHVSYPGIDHDVFRPGDPRDAFEHPTAVYLGRLRRYKGIDIVLRALARLRDEGLVVRMLVVGQGDDRDRLERVTAELGLTEQVKFPGFVDESEKVRILQRSWLNLYPSPKEGWGITNIEAAACGTPSVASDSPGLRESVCDDETGFLVPHQAVDRWSAAVRRLVEDEGLRRQLGMRCVAHAERFTWEATAGDVEAILQNAASR
jgi:glycosyltransferase involved in cell wall biosynthesis